MATAFSLFGETGWKVLRFDSIIECLSFYHHHNSPLNAPPDGRSTDIIPLWDITPLWGCRSAFTFIPSSK